MRIRDLCLDVIAYFLIAGVLFVNAWEYYKQGKNGLTIVMVILGVFSLWEGGENLMDHCLQKKKSVA